MAKVQPERLLGKRYVTDFRVVSVSQGDDGELTATLLMYGDYYRISVDELTTIIERGFVIEPPSGGT